MRNKLFVFDTNAFVSAALLSGSVNDIALDKAFKTGKVIVSDSTFAEFTEVLFRKKFDKYFNDERRLQVIQKLERDTLLFNVNMIITACRDPKDNKFLELALTADASCIVTGDQDLLILNPFNNIPIVSAADFLKLY
ncbi:MAG TPA: putative toxin-antitoxin system toxin component, PIN family [Chitinophagaceae bacterium]|nr:putative toxin-antitoxin system toxin component, PIN family [Chitinophagaceae bacterium]